MAKTISNDDFARALVDIRNEIRSTQVRTVQQVNKNLIMMYFRIGKILFDSSLNNSHFIKEISIDLKIEFPTLKGFSRRNLYNMCAFYIEYKEDEPMGGYDMYSSSKGCVEIMSSSFRRSFL